MLKEGDTVLVVVGANKDQRMKDLTEGLHQGKMGTVSSIYRGRNGTADLCKVRFTDGSYEHLFDFLLERVTF